MQTTLTARDGEAVAALAPDVQLVDWRRRVAHLYADIRAFNAPEAAHEHWIAHRTALADHHPQSPFKGAPAEGATDAAGSTPRRTLRHWPYDPNLRCFAHVEPLAEADMLRQDVGADGQLQMVAALITDGLAEQLGGELTLYALRGYAGGLFLPFRDTTNGAETYGGGRYLLDTIKSADLGMASDGRMIFDFNFAYHPSCCHAPQWVCPLSPPDNRMGIAIRAGERL